MRHGFSGLGAMTEDSKLLPDIEFAVEAWCGGCDATAAYPSAF